MEKSNELLSFSNYLAKEAGNLLREGYGSAFKIGNKEGKNNLVTEYDTRTEDMLVEKIKKEFPEHSILAEEGGLREEYSDSEIRWVIDPLDGTVNFAHNLPIFCVSIAAVKGKEILAGTIFNPITEEFFYGSKDGGAFLNDTKLYVSDVSDFDSSFLITGFPYNVDSNPCGCIDSFVDIIKRGIPVRRLGSAALDLAYVAAGRFDGFWEIGLNPWDVAAGVLLINEAGGKITQYSNEEYFIYDNSVLATNGLIHNDIVDILNECDCGGTNGN